METLCEIAIADRRKWGNADASPGTKLAIAHMCPRASSRSRWVVAVSVLLVGFVVAIAIAAAVAPALLPADDRIGAEGRSVAAGAIFVGSYLALALGRIPGLSIDRAGIALVGAGLMVASGTLSLEDAYKAVDLDTITLLLGMMIVVANLRLSGFFAVATVDRDDHRQSAEHVDRQFLPYHLYQIRPGAGASRAARTDCDGRAHRALPSRRVLGCRTAGSAAPDGRCQSRAGGPGIVSDPHHDRIVFRGGRAGQGGHHYGRSAAADPTAEEPQGLRGDRLVTAANVCRSVCYRCRRAACAPRPGRHCRPSTSAQ